MREVFQGPANKTELLQDSLAGCSSEELVRFMREGDAEAVSQLSTYTRNEAEQIFVARISAISLTTSPVGNPADAHRSATGHVQACQWWRRNRER